MKCICIEVINEAMKSSTGLYVMLQGLLTNDIEVCLRRVNGKNHTVHPFTLPPNQAKADDCNLTVDILPNVETLRKLDKDIMMLKIYNNYSRKSVLHMHLTSCVR